MTKDANRPGFILREEAGYLSAGGVDCMAFDDFYPEGHQSGVSLIMHGKRIASNGDLRFEQCPGQWQPVPKKEDRKMIPEDRLLSSLAVLDIPREDRKAIMAIMDDYLLFNGHLIWNRKP